MLDIAESQDVNILDVLEVTCSEKFIFKAKANNNVPTPPLCIPQDVSSVSGLEPNLLLSFWTRNVWLFGIFCKVSENNS